MILIEDAKNVYVKCVMTGYEFIFIITFKSKRIAYFIGAPFFLRHKTRNFVSGDKKSRIVRIPH